MSAQNVNTQAAVPVGGTIPAPGPPAHMQPQAWQQQSSGTIKSTDGTHVAPQVSSVFPLGGMNAPQALQGATSSPRSTSSLLPHARHRAKPPVAPSMSMLPPVPTSQTTIIQTTTPSADIPSRTAGGPPTGPSMKPPTSSTPSALVKEAPARPTAAKYAKSTKTLLPRRRLPTHAHLPEPRSGGHTSLSEKTLLPMGDDAKSVGQSLLPSIPLPRAPVEPVQPVQTSKKSAPEPEATPAPSRPPSKRSRVRAKQATNETNDAATEPNDNEPGTEVPTRSRPKRARQSARQAKRKADASDARTPSPRKSRSKPRPTSDPRAIPKTVMRIMREALPVLDDRMEDIELASHSESEGEGEEQALLDQMEALKREYLECTVSAKRWERYLRKHRGPEPANRKRGSQESESDGEAVKQESAMVEPDEQDSKKLRIEPEEEMTTPQKGRLSLEISPPKKKSPGGTKIYECVECGRTFTHPPAYAQHKRSHQSASPPDQSPKPRKTRGTVQAKPVEPKTSRRLRGRKKGAAVEDDATSTTNSEQDTPVEPVANANTSGRRKRAKRGKK